MAKRSYYQTRNERALRETGLTYNQLRTAARNSGRTVRELQKEASKLPPQTNKDLHKLSIEGRRKLKASKPRSKARKELRKRLQGEFAGITHDFDPHDIPKGLGWYN